MSATGVTVPMTETEIGFSPFTSGPRANLQLMFSESRDSDASLTK